ncbi:MAG TPA: hypothetical protein P5132_04250, partial [Bacteroidales bacterium]|nr:hypothetical protein [Bacteroidales bacterium]
MNSLIKTLLTIFFILSISFSVFSNEIIDGPKLSSDDVRVEMTDIIVRNIETEIKLHFKNPEFRQVYEGLPVTVYINNKPIVIRLNKGAASFKYKFTQKENFEIKISEFSYSKKITPIPLWFSVIPPLIAILFALIFKEVFTALFIGILVGTATMFWYQDVALIPA